MKITTQKKITSLLLATSLGVWSLLPAETVVTERAPAVSSTTTTTSSSGTFTEFVPGSETVTLRTEQGPANYVITKRTTIVDDAGAPVAISSIAPGRPLAVHYVREGERLVASRIVVRAAAPAAVVPVPPREPVAPREEVTTTRTTTSTTEMPGTITEFAPGQTVVVRSESGPEPARYIVNKQTTYVDETGAPLTVERIAPGAPVTVRYINEGGRMVASQIVVRQGGPRDHKDAREERKELKRDYHNEKERLEHEEKELKREERK